MGDYDIGYSEDGTNRLLLILKEKKKKTSLAEATMQLVFNNETDFEGSFEVETLEEAPLAAKFYLYACSLPEKPKNELRTGYAWAIVN